MNCEIQTLMREVRIAMDENADWHDLLAAEDTTLRLDDIIIQKIIDATRMLIEETPAEQLNNGRDFTELEINWVGNHGQIRLPDDFLRLIIFRMSDWDLPVREMQNDDTELYAMQSSPIPGIAADHQRPLVFRTRIKGDDILEFYGCKDQGATIISAEYLPEPYIVDGIIDVPSLIRMEVIYRAAGLTAMAIKDYTLSTNLIAVSNRKGEVAPPEPAKEE